MFRDQTLLAPQSAETSISEGFPLPIQPGRKRKFRRSIRKNGKVLFAFEGQPQAEPAAGVQTEKLAYRIFNVLFDKVGAGLLLACSFPAMVIIAVLIRLSSPGPVIFRQSRLTSGATPFTMFKFRTMRVDAESFSGAVWAAENDPRVTRIGTFLRRTRLDELPQLFNVLRGDMSLIGPRPERPELAASLAQEINGFERRLRIKAGLTGLAQVRNGYSSCTGSNRRKLAWDLIYMRRRSIGLDLWIVCLTLFVVIFRRGAR